ncbi:MAG: DNA primase [Planctomycetes bacterium]|nr:DNA primase [Planctomycetota bacterium]
MTRFSEQFIRQVAQATDIVDLIGRFIALKKSGKEFLGLCPFHDDHKPSMTVSPVKQIFKCFSCGAGGGVFQFVMLYEKLTFPESVRRLAEQAAIPIPKDAQEQTPGQADGKEMAGTMRYAMEFFSQQLRSAGGTDAIAYIRGRGITDESIEKYCIGYAPDFWDGLIRSAAKDGISQRALMAAGLVVKPEGRDNCYDRFRNRLIFPIFDVADRVIAFGGRALAADERAKYLNSPESPLFDKSSSLYALNWARQAIDKSGTAVVVEGYMDALMPHQAGVANVVATLGTALTERHVRMLSRYARDVVLLFDSDEAGIKAAERSIELFVAQQVNVRVASVPSGKDPCDYTLSHGGQAFAELVRQAPDALQFIWNRRRQQWDQAGGNLALQRQLLDDFLRLVVASAAYGAIDEIRRGQLAQHIGHMLNIPPADLQQQMRRLARFVNKPARPSGSQAAPTGQAGPDSNPTAAPAHDNQSSQTTADRAQRDILEVLLNRHDLFDSAVERIDPTDFTSPDLQRVARKLWDLGHAGGGSIDQLLAAQEIADLGSLVADLAHAGEKRGNFETTLDGAVQHLIYRRSQKAVQELKQSGLNDNVLDQLQRHHQQADPRRIPKIS